jgi:facilitated trehalose transporter
VSKFLTNIIAAIGASGAYFMFGSISFMGTVFVLFLVPETKGRTNDEMKSYFLTRIQKKL